MTGKPAPVCWWNCTNC